MRTFYLTSIDANTALNMIKTMLKTRDVFVDERLNTLTMRDTGDAVRMAEKLLQSQDQSNPEVVLEVEVMEVATPADSRPRACNGRTPSAWSTATARP